MKVLVGEEDIRLDKEYIRMYMEVIKIKGIAIAIYDRIGWYRMEWKV